MSSTKVLELQAQLEALKKRKADCDAGIRREAKRAKRREGGGCCASELHVAQLLHKAGMADSVPKLNKVVLIQLLMLMELVGSVSSLDFAVSFVLGQGRPKRCRNHSLDLWSTDVRRYITQGLRNLYCNVEFGMLVTVLEGPQNKIGFLCRYIVEYFLWHWLVDQNCKKGVKPGVSQLLAKACAFIPSGAPAAVSKALVAFFQKNSRGGRSRRKWIASFRKRWGVKPGMLKVGVDLQPAEMRDKAALPLLGLFVRHAFPAHSSIGFAFLSKFCQEMRTSFWRPFLGLEFGLPYSYLVRVGQFLGPEYGPKKWSNKLLVFGYKSQT